MKDAKPAWFETVIGEPVAPFTPVVSLADVATRRKELAHPALAIEPPPSLEIEHLILGASGGRELTAELVRPRGGDDLGLVVYLHGGAWCSWSAREVRRLTFKLALRGMLVLSVNYALAPEWPFPAAVEDAVFAARWAHLHAERLGADPRTLVLAGDSSGANLAAAAVAYLSGEPVKLDDRGLHGSTPQLAGALLLYGTYDFVSRLADEHHTPGVTEVLSNLAYLGPHFLSLHRSPLVSPIYAQTLGQFPPVYLMCGSDDAVLPQSLSAAQAWAKGGVPVTLSVVANHDHEFLLAEPLTPAGEAELVRIGAWLEERFRCASETELPTPGMPVR